MRIKVKAFYNLCDYLPKENRVDGNKWQPEVESGITVGEVLNMLKIPEEETKVLLINGLIADRKKTLKDGDVLSVFPPMAGG